VFMYVCVCMCDSMYVCVYICMCLCMCVYVCVTVCMYVYICVCLCMCDSMYTNQHTNALCKPNIELCYIYNARLSVQSLRHLHCDSHNIS